MSKKDICEKIKNFEFPLIIELFKWIIIDLIRFKKYGKPLHLFGIRCITGMYGQGKTTVLVYLGEKYRKKYGDSIYICSNFGFKLQDFSFDSIKQISENYNKPIIFLWDEVQNDFPATDKVFPSDVRKALTLNRKGNGKMFYWCSQDHELVHKTIRRLTIRTGQVRTIFNRLTKVKWYLQSDYIQLCNEIDIKKRMKIRPLYVEKFVQTDTLRNYFNSYGIDNGEKIT